MNLFAELIISAAVCLAIFLPLNHLRNKLRFSFAQSDDVMIELTVHASGDAESLEYAVGAAVRELGRTPFISRIVIEDGGLSPPARAVAEILSSKNGSIYISEDPEWEKLKNNGRKSD